MIRKSQRGGLLCVRAVGWSNLSALVRRSATIEYAGEAWKENVGSTRYATVQLYAVDVVDDGCSIQV